MAPRSTRRVSFAEPADSGVAAESPHPVADTHAYDPCPQPAAVRGHSAITAPEMPAAADEPEPGSVEEGGDKRTELSGHTRQARDNPLEGASAPSSACCATSLACQSLTGPHNTKSHSGPSNCLQESKTCSSSARGAYWHLVKVNSRRLRRLCPARLDHRRAARRCFGHRRSCCDTGADEAVGQSEVSLARMARGRRARCRYTARKGSCGDRGQAPRALDRQATAVRAATADAVQLAESPHARPPGLPRLPTLRCRRDPGGNSRRR